MPNKTVREERNELVLAELGHLRSAVERLETVADRLSSEVSSVRIEAIADVRREIGEIKISVAVLQSQARRSAAGVSVLVSSAISIVAAIAGALLAR